MNFRRSCRISRGGALHRKGERNSRIVPPFPDSSRCLCPFQGILFSLHCFNFQAEDRLTPRWHVTQPCGKASWESLVGKAREKATDPLIHAKGSVTLLLQLGRKAHVHAPTRDEAGEFRLHPNEPCFRLLAREEGSSPCVFGKEFPAFPSHLKRRRSPQETREELQGRATIP